MLSEVVMKDLGIVKCIDCGAMLGRTRRRYCRRCTDNGKRDKT